MKAMFLPLLGTDDSLSLFLRVLGRLHPAVVHFPIALLALAAALEGWQLLRRKPGLAAATPVCLTVGAVSSVVASALGWLQLDGAESDLASLHQWSGIAASALALLTAGLLWFAASVQATMVLRITLFVVAGLISGTGYLGGELVFGRNHLFKGVFDSPQPVASRQSDGKPSTKRTTVDFREDVAPILKVHCLRCHGGEKVSGKFSLKTRERAFKGGKNGVAIVPKQPDASSLYTLLRDEDPDRQMPPPRENPLSPEEIETIRKWIEQGAVWPEGVELE